MQLNKLGHGLAVSAVSALVISGLAAVPAHAADSDVRLLSQQDGLASVKRDASEPRRASVTLAAERLAPDAEITFQYNPDPSAGDAAAGWVDVPILEGSSFTGSYVAIEWTPDSALVGTSVAIRAVATTSGATTYSTRNNVALSGAASPVEAVSIGVFEIFFGSPFFSEFPGAFFTQPYADSSRTARLARVTGTTSATGGTVELSAWNSEAGAFQGTVDAAVAPYRLKTTSGFPSGSSTYVDGGRYAGVLDITAFDAQAGDQLAIRAERDSDDVVAAQLQAQAIGSIQAAGPATTGPTTTEVPLTVLDTNALPVVGAEVRRASDGTLVGYTNVDGMVTAKQPNSTDESYYANTSDVDAFQEGTDVATGPITAPEYVPVLADTEAVLADGDVFDDREYAAGDVALQLVDEYGLPFAGEEELSYALYPSDGTAPEMTTATTDENGVLAVPFDPSGPDGEYTLDFTSPSSVEGGDHTVTFVAGDAVLGLTPLAGTAPSGGRITYGGTLEVEGQPLAGRAVDLTYTRGTEQSPGTGADASLLVGDARSLAGQVTSDEDGTFSVTVADVVEAGGPGETGGKVTVRVLGDALAATADFTPAPVQTPPPTTTPTPDSGKLVVKLRLKGKDTADGSDRLRVRGPESVAGLRTRIHVRRPGGSWRVAKGVDLDKTGDATVVLTDRNGDEVTRYRVRLIPNRIAEAFSSGASGRR